MADDNAAPVAWDDVDVANLEQLTLEQLNLGDEGGRFMSDDVPTLQTGIIYQNGSNAGGSAGLCERHVRQHPCARANQR